MSYNTILATAPLTTQNYHLKMIGTSIGNSLIWDNGTNVGIGNTNTNYKFDVTGTGNISSTFTVGANMGMNVTPSAWATVGPVIEFTAGGFIGSQGSTNTMYVGSNNYYNGSNFIYKQNGFATQYQVGAGLGNHHWYTAPSGTAGGTISFVQAMTLTNGGNVLINRTATAGQSAKLQIDTSATDGIYVKQSSSGGYTYVSIAANNGGTYYYMVFTAGTTDTGSITSNGTTTTYSVTSDYRLKEDFKDINGLEKLLAIKVYDFKFKNSENRMDGVIAHELQEIIPYAVVGEKDGEKMQGVDYSLIVPTLVKAVQEQQIQIQNLQEQINILQNK